ncbi:maleylpyruvate isomerase family mycothiol-dependent enzyme [Streptomyces phaeochromogenes]|uniref:maleylpyruvate isomerase family mycothiol-dependent enzyme n=1 Tax=Streptomyces phaeochromogenes TaxID=1923 RepID=UPI00371093FE
MTDDHDGVPELLAAWAFGALQPTDEKVVPLHLAGCESCAAEAERLRETVRLLDVPPLLDMPPGTAAAGNGSPAARNGSAAVSQNGSAAGVTGGAVTGGGSADASVVGGGGPAGADGVLALALRSRPALPRVAAHAAPYAAAVAGLRALLREVDGHGPWGTPVVHDWDVRDTVGHLIAADEQLAVRLGLQPHTPPSRTAEDTSWEEAWNTRTADVIAYERTRDPQETVTAWAERAAALLATPEARDPERAAHATTLMGVRLPVADHFVVRGFEAWIHTDDIGRALGLAVPPPPDAHLWQLVRLAVRILGMALGPTAPPVLFAVTAGESSTEWVLGSEDEAVRGELVLDAVDFCLLVGGRYTPDEVPRGVAGDEDVVRDVLERAAALSWL